MVNLAKVFIWDKYVGAVMWDENRQSALFEYDDGFKSTGLELSPLMMPLGDRIFSFGNLDKDTFLGLPGLLADALPDAYGKALLDKWLAMNGRTFANPVERLCYQGKRSMGALEFVPAQDVHLEQKSELEISSLVEIAREVMDSKTQLNANLNDNRKEAIANIIKVGTSAGGQRAKAVVAFNENTGEVRSGQLDAPEGFGHWLLKLDGVTNASLGDPKHYGRIEYAYYLMAKNAGIEMMECRILEENGRAHFMTRRFDRLGGNEKLHSQTLCGLAHFDYKMLHAYSYEQAFQVMRRLRLPYKQAEELFRRMVFNVIARNQDDHTKNISFLMNQKGEWSLSPAYDISYCYNPKDEWTSQHQMSINGKWTDFTADDFRAVAQNIHIKNCNAIIGQVCDAVSQWKSIAKGCGIPSGTANAIEDNLLYNAF